MPDASDLKASGLPPTSVAAIQAGDRLLLQSKWQDAVRLLQPLADAAAEAGDWRTQALATIRIGRAESRMMHHTAAARALQAAVTAAQRIEDPTIAVDAIRNLGIVHQRAGDHASAREFLEEALRIADDVGLDDRRGGILLDMGNLSYQEQALVEAESRYAQALTHQLSLEDRLRALHNVALVRLEAGRAGDAREPAEELCRRADAESSFPHLFAAGLSLLGRIRAAEGATGEGLRILNDAIAKHRGLANGLSLTNALMFRAQILERAGRFADSRASFQEAHDTALARQSFPDASRAALGLARIAAAAKDHPTARQWAAIALNAAEQSGSAGLIREARELLDH